MLTLALLAGTPAVALGKSVLLAGGQAGSFPWKLTVSSRAIGSEKLPGICVSFLWAWGPGQPVGNGFPTCIAPARGDVTPHGVRWSFDLHAAGFHGVVPMASGSAGSIRGIVMLVDPRATRVVVKLRDGEALRLRTHRLPAGLHRAARIAWAVTGASPSSGSAMRFHNARAYDRRGQLVGHYG